jgi:ABC-type nitrate/sulfonate/bicarbonate transport system permease component
MARKTEIGKKPRGAERKLLGLEEKIAFGAAVPIGIYVGVRKVADKSTTPIIMLLSSLPDLALLPILVYILGYTSAAAIGVCFICAFFPI